jgi:hypothetical protein|tara:strand:- start:1799 stop:1975 length:177 start_codon:yes stop_codon:yes gene_type:complete
MLKYRVIKKEILTEGLEQEEALACVEMLRQNNPDTLYNIEEYNWSHVEKRLGRDPDLH